MTESGNVIEPVKAKETYTVELTADEIVSLFKSFANLSDCVDRMMDVLMWAMKSVDQQMYYELELMQAKRHQKEAKCSTSTDTTSSAALTGSATQLKLPNTL